VLKILVTFALRQEGVSFERKLNHRIAKSGSVLGRLGSAEVAVSWLGTGVPDEDRFKSTLTDLHSELVINSGFAGGVRTLLEPGDFVLAENFTSPELLKRLETGRVFEARGRFVCVDTVADSAAKMLINSEGNVIALDMESARVAAICRKLSVLFLSARMISDRYDERIPGVFLGKGIRQMKDISDAIAFASRMIVLRRRLADRLAELVSEIGSDLGSDLNIQH
jgi:nucleoside phosphorylase